MSLINWKEILISDNKASFRYSSQTDSELKDGFSKASMTFYKPFLKRGNELFLVELDVPRPREFVQNEYVNYDNTENTSTEKTT